MGKLSRNKGAAFERTCANELTARLQLLIERRLDETRQGNAGDLMMGGVPLCVQCKVGARPPIYPAMKQAVEAHGPGEVPVVMMKRNGAGRRPSDDFTILRTEDFLKIVEILWGPAGVLVTPEGYHTLNGNVHERHGGEVPEARG